MRDRPISIKRSRSSAISKTKGITCGRFGKHQIPIRRMTTDGMRRSSLEPSGAHDRHQETNRTAGILSRRNHDRRAIVARLSCDRGPIIARSWPDRRRSSRQRRHFWKPYDRSSIAPQSKPNCQAIVARSPRDHGPIVVRSWPDRRTIMVRSPRDRAHDFGYSTTNSMPKLGGFVAGLKPRSCPKESLPRPHQIAPTTSSIAHDLRANFPFKNQCISPLFFNF